jgi:iron complex outermembrane recepter protein
MFPGGSTARCTDPAYAGLLSRFTLQGSCSTLGLAAIARVRTQAVNGPAIKTSGIDVLADYDFGDVWGGSLRAGLTATYTIEYKIDAFTVEGVVVEKAFDAAGYLNYQLAATSLPQLKGQAYAEYERGPHNLRVTVNFIDSYIDQRASILAPNAVNPLFIQARGPKIDDSWLTNVTYRYEAPWDTVLTFTVDNLFDTDPSFARLDLNYDPFTGAPLGRTYKLSARKKF